MAIDSTSFSNETLVRRIEKLESSNRRFKLGLIASCVALICVGLGGVMTLANQPAKSREVQTQRLLVTGKDGAPRAMLTGNGNGSSLFLYGPDKYITPEQSGGGLQASAALKPRLKMIVDDESGRLEFLDPDGTQRMLVNLNAEGPSVTYFDEAGEEIVDADD